jgi:hypothetical protein
MVCVCTCVCVRVCLCVHQYHVMMDIDYFILEMHCSYMKNLWLDYNLLEAQSNIVSF